MIPAARYHHPEGYFFLLLSHMNIPVIPIKTAGWLRFNFVGEPEMSRATTALHSFPRECGRKSNREDSVNGGFRSRVDEPASRDE